MNLHMMMDSVTVEKGKRMAEYIEREAVYEKAYWHGEHPDVDNPFPDGVDAIDIKDVDAIPAADVAPVVHGRWIFGKDLPFICGKMPKNKYHLYCSECLEQAFNRSEDNDPDFDEDTSYCPNCGAKMIEVSGGE